MKLLTRMALALMAGLLWLSPSSANAQEKVVEGYLKDGGLFRIQNRRISSDYITEEALEKQNTTLNGLYGRTKLTQKEDAMRQIWIMTKNGAGYTFRNAFSGRYLPSDGGNPMVTSPGSRTLYVKYSAGNTTSKSTSYVTISWDSKYEGNKCFNENPNKNILGWKANGTQGGDAGSDWKLVPATDITIDDIKAQYAKNSPAIEPKEGSYVQIINTAYNLCMTELPGSNTVKCLPADGSMGQIWKLGKRGSRWTLQNVLTDRYVAQQGGQLSRIYKTAPAKTQSFVLAEGSDPFILDYTFTDYNGVGLHCAESHNNDVVGWYTNSDASQWIFASVDIDDDVVANAKANYAELTNLNKNGAKIKNTIEYYFEDLACTKLKSQFQSMPDEQLLQLLSAPVPGESNTIGLPKMVQNMIFKVKNATWSHREKEFRVYDYIAYNGRNAHSYIGAGHLYSDQTGPTGVHVKRGDLVTLYVDSPAPAGSTISVMNCEGLKVNGATKPLTPGFNFFLADYDGAIYINYHINSPGIPLSRFSPIKVHIEGGYVNGLFDITRGHTNKDWLDMDAKLFKDKVVHMKSNHIQFNLHLDQVREVIKGTSYQRPPHNFPSMLTDMKNNAVDKDGCPKGMEGVLRRWDEIIRLQYELMHVDQFADKCRGMTSASSSSKGNPYASSHGTYYPGVGGIVDYYDMSVGRDTDEGGNRWMVAHETGHNHQALFNQPGDTEVSNNFFSQVSAWLGGSHVGRGRPWSNSAADFHAGKFYHEYNLWQRCRMYFQLYLYFHLQGYDKNFYPKFFDLLRKKGMQRSGNENAPMSGTLSFLRFAEYACEAAQLDLSEFFQFYGYFVPLNNYTVGDYSNSYVTTTKAEIDASIAKMKKYPKGPSGLLFIDERIRQEPVPATAPSMKEKFRWATSGDARPGNASQVGEVGMYSDFRDDIEVAKYTCTYDKNSGRIVVKKDGKGAVGFKVYNSKNELVYVSNTYTFTLPANLRNSKFYVSVAYGNGQQESILDNTNITGVETLDTPADDAKVIYDLDGRRDSENARGVKIVNGKIRLQ